MHNWPDSRIQDLFGIELPLIQAPMAGFAFAEMAIAVAEAGGLGSLACASLSAAQIQEQWAKIRAATARPINLNFFCHATPAPDPERIARWLRRLAPYYAEAGLDIADAPPAAGRVPFDDAQCRLVEELRPQVVSFHFGLPDAALLERVRAAGARILGCATTVAEARWLEERGCDAVIAQGSEAGGHRGSFLPASVSVTRDPVLKKIKAGSGSQPPCPPATAATTQSAAKASSVTLLTLVGTVALVPQVVDAVRIPVIAAGGIADGRGIAAAFMLGAAAAQIGTAYLRTPEAKISAPHRQALKTALVHATAITNVLTGRPARGFLNRLMREHGPLLDDVPPFPLASGALAPLRAWAEATGLGDFSPLWSGQAASLAREIPAGELTRSLADAALARLRGPSQPAIG